MASKAKTSKLSPVEAKFVKIGLAAKDKTISQTELFKLAAVTVNQSSQDAVNSLLRKSLITMLRGSNGDIMFEFHDKSEAKAMANMDGEEKLVLDQIKDAGNLGIWTRDLTIKTGLARTTITKCLKVLENKKMIKNVKSVKNPTRKIYMLAGLTPSVELTGGPWFTDNELDTEFVSALKTVILNALSRQAGNAGDPSQLLPTSSTPSLATIKTLQTSLNAVTNGVELNDEHVESLLDTLVWEGVVEKVLVVGLQTSAPAGIKRGKLKAKKESESEDDRPRKKSKSGKSKSRSKSKKRRSKDSSDDKDSNESSEESEDFDSDVERIKKDSDESDSGKKRKSRRKNRSKKKESDSEDSSSDEETIHAPKLFDPLLQSKTDYVYRLRRKYTPIIGWTDMPCGRCPVEAFCKETKRLSIKETQPTAKSFIKSRFTRMGNGVNDGPKTRVATEPPIGVMQGVGMLGGAGAAIGTTSEQWGEVKKGVGMGLGISMPVNPRDCVYFAEWLDF